VSEQISDVLICFPLFNPEDKVFKKHQHQFSRRKRLSLKK